MSNSRDEILSTIQKNQLEAKPLPSLAQQWQQFEDPIEHFSQTLQTVGGNALVVENISEAEAQVRQLEVVTEATKICSTVSEIKLSNFEISEQDAPHSLHDVDVAIIPGKFAVAENGAVWIEGKMMPHRVLLFIAQHVVLTIPANEIVHNMHQGYQKLSLGKPEFGVFVSGPSKTADIEQSLVIGAHGARSLTIMITSN